MPTTLGTPRVAFNLMSARVGGGLTYAISQTRAFLDVWPRDRVVVLTSPWNDAAIAEATGHQTIRLSARSALDRYLIEQTLPFGTLRKHKIDVFYGIGNFLPVTLPRCRSVMALQNPNYVGEGRHLGHNTSFGEKVRVRLSHQSMRRADLVITISQALESALRTETRLNGVKTRVILSGAPDWSRVATDPSLLPHVGSSPFFLSVANDYPHKRLDDVARGFAISAAASAHQLRLVFVGKILASRQRELRAAAGSSAERLVFLGSVQGRGQIRWLYEQAWAAISASELEAFPLTPAEAACLRCPLVLTSIPPHLEVARGAGIHFEKGDVEALAHHLTGLANQNGRPLAPPWTWPITWHENASNLAQAIRDVAAT